MLQNSHRQQVFIDRDDNENVSTGLDVYKICYEINTSDFLPQPGYMGDDLIPYFGSGGPSLSSGYRVLGSFTSSAWTVSQQRIIHWHLTCCPWSHGLRTKILSVSVAVPPIPGRVPSQRPLASSVASVTSVGNDKGGNEIILGLCTDLLAFALQPRKTPENLSYEIVWWRGCATSHRLKWGQIGV